MCQGGDPPEPGPHAEGTGADMDGVRRARGRVTGGEVGTVKGGWGKTMWSVIARTLAFPQSETGNHRKIQNRAAA